MRPTHRFVTQLSTATCDSFTTRLLLALAVTLSQTSVFSATHSPLSSDFRQTEKNLAVTPLPTLALKESSRDPKSLSSHSAQIFMRYRELVPEFYQFVKNHMETFPYLKSLTKQSGITMADAHPGNFGYITLDDGSLAFTYNDWDDSDWGPWILDLIRFMGGASLIVVDPKTKDWEEWLDHYLDGIAQKNENKHLSRITAWSPERKIRLLPPKKKLTENGKIKPDEEVRTLSLEEQNILRRFLQTALPTLAQAQWLDGARKIPTTGGSRGRERLQSLWQINSQERLLLEMKPYLESSMGSWTEGSPWKGTPAIRFQEVLKVVLPSQESQRTYYRTLNYSGTIYQTRPLRTGSEGIKWEKLSEKEKKQHLETLAWVLGTLHRKNLKVNPESWIKDFSKKRFLQETQELVQRWINNL